MSAAALDIKEAHGCIDGVMDDLESNLFDTDLDSISGTWDALLLSMRKTVIGKLHNSESGVDDAMAEFDMLTTEATAAIATEMRSLMDKVRQRAVTEVRKAEFRLCKRKMSESEAEGETAAPPSKRVIDTTTTCSKSSKSSK